MSERFEKGRGRPEPNTAGALSPERMRRDLEGVAQAYAEQRAHALECLVGAILGIDGPGIVTALLTVPADQRPALALAIVKKARVARARAKG